MSTQVVSESKSVAEGNVYQVDVGNGLVVKSGVVLSTADDDAAAILGFGSNSITLNGEAKGGAGIELHGSSTLTIGASGLSTGTYGLYVQRGDVVNNYGDVSGSVSAISAHGIAGFTINNSGNIASGPHGGATILNVFDGVNHITNTGLIKTQKADEYCYESDNAKAIDIVVNSGKMVGDVYLGGGNDTFNGLKGRTYGSIDGGGGDDRIYGSVLAEKLTGGTESDSFYFGTRLNSTLADHITDFVHGQDRIGIDNFYFHGVTAEELPKQFNDITNAKERPDGHILYNHDKGALYYDVDGYGGAKPVLVALLDNHAALTSDDLFVF